MSYIADINPNWEAVVRGDFSKRLQKFLIFSLQLKSLGDSKIPLSDKELRNSDIAIVDLETCIKSQKILSDSKNLPNEAIWCILRKDQIDSYERVLSSIPAEPCIFCEYKRPYILIL